MKFCLIHYNICGQPFAGKITREKLTDEGWDGNYVGTSPIRLPFPSPKASEAEKVISDLQDMLDFRMQEGFRTDDQFTKTVERALSLLRKEKGC